MRWIIVIIIQASPKPPLYDFPPFLGWLLPDLVHDHGIPWPAHLSAVVKAINCRQVCRSWNDHVNGWFSDFLKTQNNSFTVRRAVFVWGWCWEPGLSRPHRSLQSDAAEAETNHQLLWPALQPLSGRDNPAFIIISTQWKCFVTFDQTKTITPV